MQDKGRPIPAAIENQAILYEIVKLIGCKELPIDIRKKDSPLPPPPAAIDGAVDLNAILASLTGAAKPQEASTPVVDQEKPTVTISSSRKIIGDKKYVDVRITVNKAKEAGGVSNIAAEQLMKGIFAAAVESSSAEQKAEHIYLERSGASETINKLLKSAKAELEKSQPVKALLKKIDQIKENFKNQDSNLNIVPTCRFLHGEPVFGCVMTTSNSGLREIFRHNRGIGINIEQAQGETCRVVFEGKAAINALLTLEKVKEEALKVERRQQHQLL